MVAGTPPFLYIDLGKDAPGMTASGRFRLFALLKFMPDERLLPG